MNIKKHIMYNKYLLCIIKKYYVILSINLNEQIFYKYTAQV